jgi:hypothetical protein
MPVMMGTVNGKIYRQPAPVDPPKPRRGWLPFDSWEAALIEKWKRENISDEWIALWTMRPVRQIARFNPTRPNGRRHG